MHITFLLPVVGLPRHHKRIRALRREGADVRLLAFERPDQLDPPDDQAVEIMGVIRDRAYGERAATYLRAVRFLRRELRSTDVVYCFGVDLLALARAALAFQAPRPALAVEVGDVVPAMVASGLRGAFGRHTERSLIADSTLLVSTSPAYVDGYYRGVLGLENLRSFVLENKVDSMQLPERPTPTLPDSGPLRIGYFGQLRCPRSWDVLMQLAQAAPERVQISVRGFAKGEMHTRLREAEPLSNVTYHGRYSVPDDLPSIYPEVDLTWMAFWEADDRTWKWARSNRFYESCYFSKPMIGQIGKDDTRLVEAHDIGTAIDVTRPDAAVERILSIERADLARWHENLAQLPRSTYALTNEHAKLLARLGAQDAGP